MTKEVFTGPELKEHLENNKNYFMLSSDFFVITTITTNNENDKTTKRLIPKIHHRHQSPILKEAIMPTIGTTKPIKVIAKIIIICFFISILSWLIYLAILLINTQIPITEKIFKMKDEIMYALLSAILIMQAIVFAISAVLSSILLRSSIIKVLYRQK